jgi:hypothetical protein
MDGQSTTIMAPIIQWGFAGLSGILLGILVWLIRELLGVLKETNMVIATNTHTIQEVERSSMMVKDVVDAMKDEMNKRPCIARFNVEPQSVHGI